jgi:Protein of unknown function, DUF547
MTRRTLLALALLTAAGVADASGVARAAEPPDYSAWQTLLTRYYDPARGMDYQGLKKNGKAALDELRRQLAAVDVAALPRQDQLAYWINLYNVSTVAVVVDHYPVDSIRDISTDLFIRLNVFKKPVVHTKAGEISLNDVENDKIREGFKDPRIHFAINCAAKSCPPIRTEPYVGSHLSEQLDDQARLFLNGPHGVRLEKDGDELALHVTKILDWFKDDFEKWGGGRVAFIRKFLPADKQRQIDAAKGKVDLEYDDYDWSLNDASRK